MCLVRFWCGILRGVHRSTRQGRYETDLFGGQVQRIAVYQHFHGLLDDRVGPLWVAQFPHQPSWFGLPLLFQPGFAVPTHARGKFHYRYFKHTLL
jgi:hypothetical protein